MNPITLRLVFTLLASFAALLSFAIGGPKLVSDQPSPGSFALIQPTLPTVMVDSHDDYGVVRVATDFQADVERVCGRRPLVSMDTVPKGTDAVIIGTIGKSKFIRDLVATGKLNVQGVEGAWESYLIQVVPNPMPGVAKALVIAGSDKRGAIFGTYEISEQMGVSPWYWWADVKVPHQDTLYVQDKRFVQESPKVKYRGIFINDEGPSLSNWVYKNFGEFRHGFYEHVFELLLRLKANYLWPAMWNNCFSQDDPLNMMEADQYGIVMGTSHVEPMMRADKEWNRLGYSQNDWNYLTHPKELEQFWKDGVTRNKPYESITTIAMRGKIDTPMSETANISLLENIVKTQRDILAKNVNPDVTKIPQLWALYKEVQEYYEKGMRVPDDVTLLWCDDNWGNIRRLPTQEERKRSGGAGVYYHFDYVGGPRNYKWINTNPLPKIWEQMTNAYDLGADRIWIVNVGDIKPMELPTEFFLNMAWNPTEWPASRIQEFTKQWAARNFGDQYATDIADIVSKTAKYNGRRKPELISAETFSLTNYNEADHIVADWQDLVKRAETISKHLPPEDQDAFFQLVLHPAKAPAIVNEMYVDVAKNHLYAAQGRASAAFYAAKAKQLFADDAALKQQYHSIHNGKWDHMMDQTHIGYTGWQQPDTDVMPELANYDPTNKTGIGVSMETLPDSDPWSPAQHFTVFQKGDTQTDFKVTATEPWLRLDEEPSQAPSDHEYQVLIDWKSAPKDRSTGHITITGANQTITIQAPVFNPDPTGIKGFIESNGVIAIEPEHGKKAPGYTFVAWSLIPDYGRTSSGYQAGPVSSVTQSPLDNLSYLEYPIYTFTTGDIKVNTITSPSLAFQPGHGLRIGVSIDDEKPQIVDITAHYLSPEWEESVRTNSRVIQTTHHLSTPGPHKLKIWAVDPGVVVQRLIIDLGGLQPSYLGPAESTLVN